MPDVETCEACGASFRCGAADGVCWCDELTVDPAALAALREEFSRCLCPQCLRARAAAGAAAPRPA